MQRFPEDSIIRCPGDDAVESLFMSTVKEVWCLSLSILLSSPEEKTFSLGGFLEASRRCDECDASERASPDLDGTQKRSV